MLYLVQNLLEEFIHLAPHPLATFMLALLLWKLTVRQALLITLLLPHTLETRNMGI
jgi:hypothetical protein